ncbi:Hypothetical Protein FCC1311_007542 [Hondaea fermentalgiana]|uniref:Uncharacterized protein n=1 Tax=Hondaea fermentalgiana TaxID=2315210 RepID=A0A2R5G1X0_9STRA|nr:Hypothetical Protein FCC1311_007542 [Hondaea fermentalgiana]|eukprot:GBG24535.1 Hypothetical Protein FCC1311_007542 [Hondaea fermentalgiana]
MPLDGGQMPSTRLAVGDFVKSADGKNISHVAVASITPVHSQTKVRMPLTPSCRLDVNGIVVSCASTGTAPPNLLAALLVPVRVLHAIMPLAWYTAIHDHIIIAFAGPLHFLLAVSICALLFRFAEVSNTVKCIVHILFHTNG